MRDQIGGTPTRPHSTWHDLWVLLIILAIAVGLALLFVYDVLPWFGYHKGSC